MFFFEWGAPRCGCCEELRAMTQQQIAAQMAAQASMMRNSDGMSLYNAMMLMNYRPPVHVPEGWAEWFAHPDLIA